MAFLHFLCVNFFAYRSYNVFHWMTIFKRQTKVNCNLRIRCEPNIYEQRWDLISILFAPVPISFIRVSRPAASNETVTSRPIPSIFFDLPPFCVKLGWLFYTLSKGPLPGFILFNGRRADGVWQSTSGQGRRPVRARPIFIAGFCSNPVLTTIPSQPSSPPTMQKVSLDSPVWG